MGASKKNAQFYIIIDALLDKNQPFPPKYLHTFSDISDKDLKNVKQVWSKIEPQRRLLLLKDLAQLFDTDTLLCFDDLGRFALGDENPQVRSQAIRLLWECDDPQLVSIFSQMILKDTSDEVKATAAGGLGKFVYLGELEEISAELLKETEDLLLNTYASEKSDHVQQQALEALGFSSRKEIPGLILGAYKKNDKKWIISALFAMGRSADGRWESAVMQMIKNSDKDIAIEAVHSAGELELVVARKILLDIVRDETEDEDLRFSAIWSLSKIGGEDVRETLEELLDSTQDDEEISILEEALDNLDFTNDLHSFDIYK